MAKAMGMRQRVWRALSGRFMQIAADITLHEASIQDALLDADQPRG